MRGKKLFLISLVVLVLSIGATIIFRASLLPVLLSPAVILSFFGVLLPLMWLEADLSVPKPVNIPAVSKNELVQKLLSLNSNESPFEIKQKGERIIAHWNLVDARWFEFFKRVNLKENYELHLLPIEKDRAVRAVEIVRRKEKGLGIPFFWVLSYFRGWQLLALKKELAYGIKEIFPLTMGKLYQIDFYPDLFRAPLLKIITDSGWKIQPCPLSLKWGI